MTINKITKDLDELINNDNATAAEKVKGLYYFAQSCSQTTCQWYWMRINRKRQAAFIFLVLIFILIIIASLMQFFLVSRPESTLAERLLYSQLSIGLYALSFIFFAADRVFGWTSGWVRYVCTVMDIETCYARFLADWFQIAPADSEPVSQEIYQRYVVLVQNMIKTIGEKQGQETAQWAAEFGDGVNQLKTIMSQKIARRAQDNSQDDKPGQVSP